MNYDSRRSMVRGGSPRNGSKVRILSGPPSLRIEASATTALFQVSVRAVRVMADAPVTLVDHAGTERPGLDQVERDVVGDRRQERRAAGDDDRTAEHAQLVDEAELDGPGGQAGATDRDILVRRLERRRSTSRKRNQHAPSPTITSQSSRPDLLEVGPEPPS